MNTIRAWYGGEILKSVVLGEKIRILHIEVDTNNSMLTKAKFLLLEKAVRFLKEERKRIECLSEEGVNREILELKED